ncbi:hypothetical protein ACHAWF_012562 [Thalassiosira exigua]
MLTQCHGCDLEKRLRPERRNEEVGMSLSLSFGNITVSLTALVASTSASATGFDVRHCDGRIESDIRNFSGTLVISQREEPVSLSEGEDSALEENAEVQQASSSLGGGDDDGALELEGGHDPEIPHQSDALPPADADGHSEAALLREDTGADLTFHELCRSEYATIDELRAMLRSSPRSASIPNDVGYYPAHIFADNDAMIYAQSQEEGNRFVFELYRAYPPAFSAEGSSGQIPFCGALAEWIDDVHQLYSIDSRGKVARASELRTRTKSCRVVNSLCVREDVQRLMSLPVRVALTPKVVWSIVTLSALIDGLARVAWEKLSCRGKYYLVASKHRKAILQGIAKLPFLLRTLLLVNDSSECDQLLQTSAVRGAMFCCESVDLWLVAFLDGSAHAKDCAARYLSLISDVTLDDLFGFKGKIQWSDDDISRFNCSRIELYDCIGKLCPVVPSLLLLGPRLYDVADNQVVKHIVEKMAIEMIYRFPSRSMPDQYYEVCALAWTISSYFLLRDIGIAISLSVSQSLTRYTLGTRCLLAFSTMISSITIMSLIYIDDTVENKNFAAFVLGLLWWKFVAIQRV